MNWCPSCMVHCRSEFPTGNAGLTGRKCICGMWIVVYEKDHLPEIMDTIERRLTRGFAFHFGWPR